MGDTEKQKEYIAVAVSLNAAVANVKLYSAQHPQAVRNLAHAYDRLRHVFKNRSELTYIIIDETVVVDNQTLAGKTPHLSQLADMLRNNGIERITFTKDVTPGELAALVTDLANEEMRVLHSSQGIKLGKVKMAVNAAKLDVVSPEALQKMKELGLLDDKPIDEMKEVFHQIQTRQTVPEGGLQAVVQGFISGMLYNIRPLDLLSSLKGSDEYTFTHAINVCILTMAQAEAMGLKGGQLYDIGVAAAMHDVGKIFVPDEILNKPGKLDDEEWAVMRHHTVRGARYILKTKGLPKLAFIAALEHHIRYDGTGYPHLQNGWRPNIVSQMIAVADLFDAMRSRRPYQDPKPDALILKILMEESGTSFNPRLVNIFLHIVQQNSRKDT